MFVTKSVTRIKIHGLEDYEKMIKEVKSGEGWVGEYIYIYFFFYFKKTRKLDMKSFSLIYRKQNFGMLNFVKKKNIGHFSFKWLDCNENQPFFFFF